MPTRELKTSCSISHLLFLFKLPFEEGRSPPSGYPHPAGGGGSAGSAVPLAAQLGTSHGNVVIHHSFLLTGFWRWEHGTHKGQCHLNKCKGCKPASGISPLATSLRRFDYDYVSSVARCSSEHKFSLFKWHCPQGVPHPVSCPFTPESRRARAGFHRRHGPVCSPARARLPWRPTIWTVSGLYSCGYPCLMLGSFEDLPLFGTE